MLVPHFKSFRAVQKFFFVTGTVRFIIRKSACLKSDMFVLFLAEVVASFIFECLLQKAVCLLLCVWVCGRSPSPWMLWTCASWTCQTTSASASLRTGVIFLSLFPSPSYYVFHILSYIIVQRFVCHRDVVTVWLKYLWDKLLYSQTGFRVYCVVRMEHVQWAEHYTAR